MNIDPTRLYLRRTYITDTIDALRTPDDRADARCYLAHIVTDETTLNIWLQLRQSYYTILKVKGYDVTAADVALFAAVVLRDHRNRFIRASERAALDRERTERQDATNHPRRRTVADRLAQCDADIRDGIAAGIPLRRLAVEIQRKHHSRFSGIKLSATQLSLYCRAANIAVPPPGKKIKK